MNILLYGKNSHTLKSLAEKLGFKVVGENPEVVVSYGGDGTLLSAERKFPQIPKLPIRDSSICKKCSQHSNDHLLKLLLSQKLKLEKLLKLEASIFGKKFAALNDIVIRNTFPIHAVRFEIKVNGKIINPKIIIGDGIVVSSPFGSAGYYKSITKETFTKGFRVAFNNTTEIIPTFNLSAGDELALKIIRGPATLSFDNNHELEHLKENDLVKIKASKEQGFIYQPETLRCLNCVVQRDKRLSVL